MSKQNGEVVGFTFQEIPLDEALNVVLAGDGSYSDVKQALLERLPTLPAGKAFAFGLPGGKEVPENQRRGLCVAVNHTLKRARMGWRVTYSSTKKMFICVPSTVTSAKEGGGARGVISEEDKKVLSLREQGLSVLAIAKQVSMSIGRVKYLCYHVATGRTDRPPREASSNGATDLGSPAKFVESARKLFNYKGDFTSREERAGRKAICIVGLNDLGFRAKALAPLLSLTPGGVYFNAHRGASNLGAREVKALQKAIKQEG